MIGILPGLDNPFNRNRRAPDASPVGSMVAAREFANALLTHHGVEPLVLLVPDTSVDAVLNEARVALGGFDPPGLQVCGLSQICAVLEAEADIALHEISGPSFHCGSYIRCSFSRRTFPITSVTYGLSPQGLLWDYLKRL